MKKIVLFIFQLLLFATGIQAQSSVDSATVGFSLKWPRAEKIALIATFNNFNPEQDLLTGPDSTGTWHLQKKLPYGKYEYRFLIDDEIYLRDPENPNFGGTHSNSVLYLDPPQKPGLKLLSPLPGEMVTHLPLDLKIRFLPGNETDKIDSKNSLFTIDGVKFRPQYDRSARLIHETFRQLPEGRHSLEIRVEDRKKNRTRVLRTLFIVNVRNQPPVAEAGYSLFCRPAESVHLNAGLSFDPDLNNLTEFRWAPLQPYAGFAQDSLENSPFPLVRFTAPGDYRFTLSVSDGRLWSVPDTVTVHCRPFARTFAQFRLDTADVPAFLPLKSVTVAGEFNRWKPDADSLAPEENGRFWSLQKPAAPGKYEYKFVLNGDRWIADPANPRQVEDGWNGVNSVVTVDSFFHVSPHWDFALSADGIRINNRQGFPFSLLADDNNPQTVAVGDSLLQIQRSMPGHYFFYALTDSAGACRRPKNFLINNKGAGQAALADFHQSPGWAAEAVTYQIFLRRFAPDSSVSGTLDFLRQKLDYLQELGVTCVWLMPVMPSPTEHGYTPVDYFGIEKDYGTLADFDSLVAEIHRRDMKIFFDFIANHSSDQHPYFLSAWWNPASAFRDWYIWNGARQYDFHNDWDQLPNLNYENPNVRHFMLQAADFWILHGVDGFRCDAAWGVPHDFWKDFRRRVKSRNPQVVLLDEVLPRDPAFHELEFDMSYDTDFYGNVLDVFSGRKSAAGLRFGLEKTQLNYPPEVVDFRYIENQDMDRFIAKFGPEAARAAATLLFTLPGMPLVYYGQEVGMTEMRGPMRWELVGNEMYRFYKKLIHLRRSEPAFTAKTLEFVPTSAADNVLAYFRKSGGSNFLVVINFSGAAQQVTVGKKLPVKMEYILGARDFGPGIHYMNPAEMALNPYDFVILQIPSF